MRVVVATALALLAGLTAGGCHGFGGSGGSQVVPTPGDLPPEMREAVGGASAAGKVVEAFRPTKARVHPLSRVVKEPETGEESLLVQLELTDAWGHTCKWPGVARVQLSGAVAEEKEGSPKPKVQMNSAEPATESAPAAGESGATGGGQVWWVDLRDPEANARAFDTITQTYLLRVPLKSAAAGSIGVRVEWVEADGAGQPVTIACAAANVSR